MKKNKIFLPLLFLVLSLGLFLRVYRLTTVPPSLNWDEISHGYNAYSLLKTGSDEWGQPWPIANFRAYGDYPLPLNLYITMPFVGFLGLNVFSIRLPHALLGTLTILATYFLALGVSRDKKISLLASLLVAVDPWLLFSSRFVLQSNLAIFFLTAGMAAFFNRQKNKYLLPISVVSLGLTLFSYHSTRIFTPLLILPLVFLYRKEIFKKSATHFISIIIFLAFFVPLPFILLNPTARARSTDVFLLNPSVVYSIEVARNASQLPSLLQKLIYNRPVYLATHFVNNYLGYFSPQFLFFEGGTQYQFSIPHNGLIYIIELPFFYFGLMVLLKNALIKRDKTSLLLLWWLLLSPIPASITTEQFAVIRATTMLPLPELISAIGFFELLKVIKSRYHISEKLFISFFIACLLVSSTLYMRTYFTSYKADYSWAWQYGYEEAVDYASAHYSNYDKIIMTKKYGEPHEFVLFFNSWDPSKYKSDPNLVRFNQSNWWWVDAFDKYIFMNDWQIPKDGYDFVTEKGITVHCPASTVRCLLITSPGNALKNWVKLKTINFLDNKPAFEIYEN